MSMPIPVDQLRKTDLSILVYFVVLVEERTVANAAKRLNLSQPALTRALLRLREIFNDELLVRTDSGYQPTLRGEELLTQLAEILPKVEDLISGGPFDPSTATTEFKITAADSLCHFYAPIMARKYKDTPNISYKFLTYDEARYAGLEINTQDLVLDAQYKALAGDLRSEVLFEEEFVCAVAKQSSHGEAFDLKTYLAAEHVTVTTLHDIQAIPDLSFARDGIRRRSPYRLPYFAVALTVAAGSDLVVTLPRSLALLLLDTTTTRLVEAPRELGKYRYIMVWHRRQENDSRHLWLRHTIRSATRDLMATLDDRKTLLTDLDE